MFYPSNGRICLNSSSFSSPACLLYISTRSPEDLPFHLPSLALPLRCHSSLPPIVSAPSPAARNLLPEPRHRRRQPFRTEPFDMVQIKEFRIVMPMSLDEYQVAQAYMVTKMQQQSTTDKEGVDVLESRPFGDDQLGKGHYTSKLYRLQSKAPTWLTSFAPADALVLQEEAWNAYPRCKTVIKCPYFTRFSLTIETIHKPDSGQSENVHCLNKQQLATRQVEIIDIGQPATDYWSYMIGSTGVDFSEFKSAKTGRGPLLDGWQDKCNPVMTAYKLVTVDAPYWGFGSRLEQAMLSGERALFIESHRNCFSWIDEWHGMTMQQVRELDQKNLSLVQKIGMTKSLKNGDDLALIYDVDVETKGVYYIRTCPASEQQPLALKDS